MSELLAMTLPYIYFNAQLCTALRLVYTCDFLCNFFRALARYKNSRCKLVAISVRFVAVVSNMFETWCNLVEIAGSFALQSQRNRLVYICDKSCIGERNKNRMFEWAFILVYHIISGYFQKFTPIGSKQLCYSCDLQETRQPGSRFFHHVLTSYILEFLVFTMHVNIGHLFSLYF